MNIEDWDGLDVSAKNIVYSSHYFENAKILTGRRGSHHLHMHLMWRGWLAKPFLSDEPSMIGYAMV